MLLPQFDTKLVESVVYWLDNKIVVEGQGFTNQSTLLYPQRDRARSLYSFASPYKGWVYDSCATGATIPSGFYNSSGQFLTRASGLSFDFDNGRVLSSGDWGTLSGNYANKDYNVYYSNEEQTDFFLEQLYKGNKDLSYTQTGVPHYIFAAPCVIVTNAAGQNQTYALGGLENSTRTIRLYAISNSNYNQEALGSIIMNSAHSYLPLMDYSDTPLNFYGDVKTGYYNYCDIKARLGCKDVFIKNAYSYKVADNVNSSTYYTISIYDLDLECIRFPRP